MKNKGGCAQPLEMSISFSGQSQKNTLIPIGSNPIWPINLKYRTSETEGYWLAVFPGLSSNFMQGSPKIGYDLLRSIGRDWLVKYIFANNAEGATAPETLRQMNRCYVVSLWRVISFFRQLNIPKEQASCHQWHAWISQVQDRGAYLDYC